LLDRPALGLLCSRACPGGIILRAYDLALALRAAGVPVIGGFHAPLERELLAVLLRAGGTQPVVWARAHGLGPGVARAYRAQLAAGRLLIVSTAPHAKRETAAGALARNRYVAERACVVLIVHAAPGGATEAFATELAAHDTPLLTLDEPANANMAALGARAIGTDMASWPAELRALCAG
jgi:predicted Rossmann fold nucleotide-binding protein DprA/Smf involved in DNA uptake